MSRVECTCKVSVGRSGLLAQQYEDSAYIVRCQLCKNAPDALAEVWALLEEGILVRNITGDGDSTAYLQSATRVVAVLAKMRDILKPRCPHCGAEATGMNSNPDECILKPKEAQEAGSQ